VKQGCGVGSKISESDVSKISDSNFPKFPTPTPQHKGNEIWLLKPTEIVVHSKKFMFQQKFQKKLWNFNRNSQFKSMVWKIIQLDIRSRTKNPTPIPGVVSNPTPTPHKNLRLLVTLTPTPAPQPCGYVCQTICQILLENQLTARLKILLLTVRKAC